MWDRRRNTHQIKRDNERRMEREKRTKKQKHINRERKREQK
jgi:hypothetical protein